MSKNCFSGKKLVYLTSVWPEPKSSAAGWRSLGLIRDFLEFGFEIEGASSSLPTHRSFDPKKEGLNWKVVQPNDLSFDQWLKEKAPDVIVFDRFIQEEKFAWRVAQVLPECLRILDTQDLHFLRDSRFLKQDYLKNPKTIRELASILKSDLTLLVSQAEVELLLDKPFNILEELIFWHPFGFDHTQLNSKQLYPTFEERRGYVWIGNHRHPPNQDALEWLKTKIWPEIKKLDPHATLTLMGAYPSKEVMTWSKESMDVIHLGEVEDPFIHLKKARVLLAPLRFGAGLKGKILEALCVGTPVITTAIGAEGIDPEMSVLPESFSEAAVFLHSKKELWIEKQKRGWNILWEKFSNEYHRKRLKTKLQEVFDHKDLRRSQNWIGKMLQTEQYRSTEYMSRWIELKQKLST